MLIVIFAIIVTLMCNDALNTYLSWDKYLSETSPVVTTDVVDMTFLPATSTASQTLSANAHKKNTQVINDVIRRHKAWYNSTNTRNQF